MVVAWSVVPAFLLRDTPLLDQTKTQGMASYQRIGAIRHANSVLFYGCRICSIASLAIHMAPQFWMVRAAGRFGRFPVGRPDRMAHGAMVELAIITMVAGYSIPNSRWTDRQKHCKRALIL